MSKGDYTDWNKAILAVYWGVFFGLFGLFVFLLCGCSYLKKTYPDDACIPGCRERLEQVDVYRLDGKTCTCWRVPDSMYPGDPGATATFTLP